MTKAGPYQNLTLVERIAFKLINNRFVGPVQRFNYYSSLSLFAEKMAMAATYSILGSRHPHNQETFAFLSKCNINPSQIVDLGCSDGGKTRLLAEMYPNARCWGIDLDDKKIRYAISFNESSPRVSFICSDLSAAYSSLGIRIDKSILFLSHVLEHIESPKDFLALYKNCFNYFYIEVPDFDNSYLGGLRESLGLDMLLRDPDHRYEFRRDELIDVCCENGLNICSIECRFGVIRVLASSSSWLASTSKMS